jgi:hypothetical protein
MKFTCLLILVFLLTNCSFQNKLEKKYLGQPEKILFENFSKPVKVVDAKGKKVYVFEETKDLKSAEISQGKLALDPMVTPKVKKTDRYWFTVSDRVIVKIMHEKEYER